MAAICQSPCHPLPFNPESVANFSRTSFLARRRKLAQPSASKDMKGIVKLDLPNESRKVSPSKASSGHDLTLGAEYRKRSSSTKRRDGKTQRNRRLRSYSNSNLRLHQKNVTHNRTPAHCSIFRMPGTTRRTSNQPVRMLVRTSSLPDVRLGLAAAMERRKSLNSRCLQAFKFLFSCWLGTE